MTKFNKSHFTTLIVHDGLDLEPGDFISMASKPYLITAVDGCTLTIRPYLWYEPVLWAMVKVVRNVLKHIHNLCR